MIWTIIFLTKHYIQKQANLISSIRSQVNSYAIK